jgi:hypothetical protein
MNKFHVCCFLGALAAIGCGGDETSSSGTKSEVDVAALEDEGVVAEMTEEVAAIGVPLATPFPEADKDEIEDVMMEAASLVVSSDESGATANLSDGTPVDGEPSAPGEFSWELDEERTTLTINFFNETASGMSIDKGAEYTAVLSIAENKFTDELPATSFTVTVD